ncbi:ABC transporter permease [Sphingomonas elodea]|uniref:ABC transporter permease n=1 Tax=Sphingomonas elodea TaxID=179878 RepID=UPI000590D992|nr:ABC transporter permease [Sphingomonas elodea]
MATVANLSRAWAIQRRVIGALFIRELLTRFGRHNIGFLWLFVEPMMFTVGVTILWTAFKSTHGSNIPITAFAVSGYSSVLLWRNMPSRCILAIQPNLSLMYHRYVKVIDIFLARLLVEGGGATLSFIILTLFFSYMGWMSLPEDVLKVAFGWFMLAWFGCSFAIFVGCLAEETELVEKLWHPISYFLLPVSGAAYIVDALPPAFQKVVLILPLVHGVELVREGFFGSHIRAHYDMGYLATINAVLTFMALVMLRRVGAKVVPE